MNTISAKHAIINAKRTVVLPCVTLIFSGLIWGTIVVMRNHEEPWPFLGCVFAGFLLAWLYWSFAITYWRIWAYENVRNVHDLKAKAVRYRIVWPEGSWLEKTEIRTEEQREQLKKLERKFKEKDVFQDDLSVPKETKIHFSRAHRLMGFFFLPLVFLSTGFYILIKEGNFLILICALATCYYIFSATWKKAKIKGPLLILNSSGIQLNGKVFISWTEIINAEIVSEQHGRYIQYYLVIETHFEHVKTNILEFGIGYEKLEHLLHVYRVRNEKTIAAHGNRYR